MYMELALDASKYSLTELVGAASAGSHEAFRQLVEPHLGVALRSAIVMTGSESDAADVVQEAMLIAWQRLVTLRDAAAFPAWFRQIVVRSTLKRLRHVRHVVALDLTVPAPLSDLDDALNRRQLERAFGTLDDDDRIVLTLRHLWRLSTTESAKALGIPEGTVKSRTHHALERLRAAYAAEERR